MYQPFHQNLIDGERLICSIELQLIHVQAGRPYNRQEEYLLPNTPPSHHPDVDHSNWTPYGMRLEFECPFTRIQISAGKIGSLSGTAAWPPLFQFMQGFIIIQSTPLSLVTLRGNLSVSVTTVKYQRWSPSMWQPNLLFGVRILTL